MRLLFYGSWARCPNTNVFAIQSPTLFRMQQYNPLRNFAVVWFNVEFEEQQKRGVLHECGSPSFS